MKQKNENRNYRRYRQREDKHAIQTIGSDAYTADGKPNKAVISRFLLASERNAKAIDAIVHPAVFEAFKASGLNALESAIIFESGAYKLVDRVVCVIAPREVRIHRVMERDHISQDAARQWIGRQWPQEQVAGRADFVIRNNGTGTADIEQQITSILENIQNSTFKTQHSKCSRQS